MLPYMVGEDGVSRRKPHPHPLSSSEEVFHLVREYPDGAGGGSGSSDDIEKDDSKDNFLEVEFRKRRKKVREV